MDVSEVGDVAVAPVVPGFELGRLLARGATSEVWAAVALDGGRRVAVKVVHAELGELEAAAREAAVSARAASAHVVEVEACVQLGDGRVALVMPHLRGGPLDALVRARGYLSPGEVVTVLAPVASAVGRLHDLGVVHGDVSPGNVLLDLEGRPVLGDLGLGHVVGEVSPGVWGTDGYVAPEVLLGSDPTPASDVYALGALGWLCLSGTVPGPPGLRPELAAVNRAGAGSAPLVAAIDLAVAPDPADRPGAHELAWLLFGAAEAEPLHLVEGDDAVSSVTYRLRAAAGAGSAGDADGPWWRRRWPVWSAVGRSVQPRHARPRPPGARVAAARPDLPAAVRAVAPVALGLVLAALLVLCVAVLGRPEGPVPARAAEAAEPVPPRAAADPRLDPLAPRSRPVELLQRLAEERAAAWREAEPHLLLQADAPGSPAAARDEAALAGLVRAGVRYRDLRYTVVSAVAVPAVGPSPATASDPPRPARMVLRARIDAGAYTVVERTASGPTTTPDGRVVESRTAVAGAPVLVSLVRTGAGWRIDDVGPAP